MSLLILVACGPSYETRYRYVAPKNQSGRQCVNSCLRDKADCQSGCQQTMNSCATINSITGMFDGSYSKDTKKKCKTNSSNGYRDTKCESSAFSVSTPTMTTDCEEEKRECNNNCNENYNACYSNCGGIVEPYEVCVDFCEKGSLLKDLII